MESGPDSHATVSPEPRPTALERYFAVILPEETGVVTNPEPPDGVIRINTAEPIVAEPVVAARLSWSQRLRQFDDRMTERLDRADQRVLNFRPVAALMALGKTNSARVEESTEQTERPARLAAFAGILAVGGVAVAGGKRLADTTKQRATGAYLWLRNPENANKERTVLAIGTTAVLATAIWYASSKGFGIHHGLDTSQAHHPEATPTPHPHPLPSPKPSHHLHPPGSGHHTGQGGGSPKQTVETGAPVRVHNRDGYTNLINRYAHTHHLRTNGAENYRVYLQLHQLYGRHILEGISSYHLPNHGGLGISHPGLAHWHHGAQHEINTLLKTAKKKRRFSH